MLNIRSGVGYDIHRVKGGNGLYIGGIMVSENKEFVAHSDGDVLIHALIDSLLGAIGEEDIGEKFPNSDISIKDISSEKLLKKVVNLMNEKNVEIINIDSVVIAEDPPLSPFKSRIKKNISEILNISSDRFNLKAKTGEGIGEIGEGKAIECYCICMVRV